MKLSNIKSLAGSAFLTLTLSGCASMFSVGGSEFGCAGMSEGVQCLSAAEVYELTEEPGPVTGEDYQAHMGRKNQGGNPNVVQYTAPSDPYAEAYREMLQNMPVNQEAMPLRTRPQIMRIWVAPWNSEEGDHHQQGLIYTELDGRTWNMGAPGQLPSNSIRPLGN